jgi:RNA polymerase sigma-70 factor (ECF subfamily)
VRHYTSDTGRNPALADEEIVRRVLSGEVESFEILMRRYNQRLFRVVRSIVNNDDEAEDVLQDCYLRAFKHLRQFAGRAQFSTWLIKIGVHEALARHKRRQRMKSVDFDAAENTPLIPASGFPTAEQIVSNKELRAVLEKVIKELPVGLRLVFAMRMIEGVSTSESAECLDLTEANVKVRLHRARTILQSKIDSHIGKETRMLYQFDGVRCDRIVQSVLRRLQGPSQAIP